MWCCRFIVFISFLFCYLSTLKNLFIVCSGCVLCDDGIQRGSSSIDHELQFVYARFDFAKCDAREREIEWASEPRASQAVKPNYCAHSSIFAAEVDCTAHTRTQSYVHRRIINYVWSFSFVSPPKTTQQQLQQRNHFCSRLVVMPKCVSSPNNDPVTHKTMVICLFILCMSLAVLLYVTSIYRIEERFLRHIA